jgi:UDP-glucose-4-epimerase GalE
MPCSRCHFRGNIRRTEAEVYGLLIDQVTEYLEQALVPHDVLEAAFAEEIARRLTRGLHGSPELFDLARVEDISKNEVPVAVERVPVKLHRLHRSSAKRRAALRWLLRDPLTQLPLLWIRSPVVTSQGTVLVTGGAGYIGSHTVRALREAGREVVVLDSLELGRREAVIDSPLVVGNITDQDLVAATCNDHGVTQVVHFAAYKSVGESMGKPDKYWRNNVAGSVELVEALLAADVHDIVFSSSCSVYGTPDIVPVTEQAAIAPESIYAESKAMVEKILRWYGETSDLRSVSLRYFNAAGASHDGRIGEDWAFSINLIPMAMKALLLEGHGLKVFGDDYDTPDGTCIRDYIHVEDLADAHVKALDYLAGGGVSTAVNLGTGEGSSVLDVINTTSEVSGQQVPYELAPRRAGDPSVTYADPRHAEETLGWKAEQGLDEIVRTAYAWHLSQLDGQR